MGRLEDIKQATKIENILNKHMKIASIITAELAEKGTTAVIVGGAATEFYTNASRLTQDIDFIVPHTDHIKEVMNNLGFLNDAGTFYLPDYPDIMVEFPAGPLDGDWDRVQRVSVQEDHIVNIIGIEDIIIDRACAVSSGWGDTNEWVNYMVLAHYNNIDWEYLNERGEHFLCSQVLQEGKRWAEEQTYIKTILNLPPISETTETTPEIQYKYQVKNYIENEIGTECNKEMDIWIAVNMLKKQINKDMIKTTIASQSFNAPNMSDNAREYAKNITNKAQKAINKEKNSKIER